MCAEVKLYLMILERLGSWEKALEVLQAPLGEPPLAAAPTVPPPHVVCMP